MSHPDPVGRFFGGALMAVGGLIALLCGTCTGFFMILSAVSMAQYPSAMSLGSILSGLLLYLLVGGLPTLIGVFLFRIGLRRFRPPKPKISKTQIAMFSDGEKEP